MGLFLSAHLRYEPIEKRAVAFIDGQNLFHAAKLAFGHNYPNYDVRLLALKVCGSRGWKLHQARFYTGVPDQRKNPTWHRFWSLKLSAIGRDGVAVIERPLQYHSENVQLPDGSVRRLYVPLEKGIDVRIAVDAIRLGLSKQYEVALIFSQDQDLGEIAVELRKISAEQNRWIKVASAYPHCGLRPRGIPNTDWIPIPRHIYDGCLDHNDYWS